MKFLLDENVERRLIPFLKQLGHDVTRIGDDYPSGLLDEKVLAIAHKEERIVITHDRSDFGELIFRKHRPHCGVILFSRFRSGDIVTKKERLSSLFASYANQLHSFLVLTPQRIRIHKAEQKQAA